MKRLLIISSTSPFAVGSIRNILYLLSHYPSDRYCFLNKSKLNQPPLEGIEKKPAFLRLLQSLFSIIQIIRIGRKTIRQQKSEMLICVSDRGIAYLGSYLLSKIARVPYSLLVFDIYSVFLARGILKKIICTAFESLILKPFIFQNTTHIIVLNDEVKQFLEQKYKTDVPITIIHTSAPQRDTTHVPQRTAPPYIITFTGSLYILQRQALINLIEAIRCLSDLDILLEIFTPDVQVAYALPLQGIKSRVALVPPEKIADVQMQADILFLPLSWNTGCEDLIKTTTPGKMSEYLIAGRPILVHAPANSCLVNYARKHEFAEVADQNDSGMLSHSIRKLLMDKQYGAMLVENAKKTYFLDHDIEKNAKSFASLFS